MTKARKALENYRRVVIKIGSALSSTAGPG